MRWPDRLLTPERLLAIAARSTDHARIQIVSNPGVRDRINNADLALTDQVVCWCQTVLPADATQAQRAAARIEIAAAVRLAAARRGWPQPVEVEDEHSEGERMLLTTYVFKTQ